MLTTGRPATIPAKATTPSPAARTGAASAPARSTPRWPGPYACGGASKGRATTRSASGAVQRATVAGRVLRGGRRGRRRQDADEDQQHCQAGCARRAIVGADRRRRTAPRAICGCGRNAGENHGARSRMLSGAARSDGSTSRVLLPPVQAGQSPPRSQRATAGGVAPLDARAAHHPVPAATEKRGHRPRAQRKATMAVVSMKQLLDSGVHFGHQTRRWNPKMKRFIFTERNGIYIIDLQQTLGYIDNAYEFVKQTVAHGGSILFVGTKKQAQEAVAEQATRVGMPYVNQRWLGGMLTNFQTVYKRLQRLKELEDLEQTGALVSLSKKEQLVLSPREGQARAHPRRYPRHAEGAQRHLDRGHQEGAHRRRRGAQAEHPGRRDPRHQLRPRRGRLQDPGQRRRDPQHRRADPRDRRRRRRGPHGPLRRAGQRRSRRGRAEKVTVATSRWPTGSASS